MMDSAEKGKAYDQAIMPVQMLSQVPYFSRDERRKLLPSITLKEVMTYRDALKPVRDLNSGHWQYERSSDDEHGAGYPKTARCERVTVVSQQRCGCGQEAVRHL